MREKISGPKGLTQDERMRAGFDTYPYGLFERRGTYMAMGASALLVFFGVHACIQTDKGLGPTTRDTHPDTVQTDPWYSTPHVQVPSPADQDHRPLQPTAGIELPAPR